jgi:Calcineurin-like phosphoesterase
MHPSPAIGFLSCGPLLPARAQALSLLAAAAALWGCPSAPEVPSTSSCSYVASGSAACCNGGAGCSGGLWCNTRACACEDIESPCSSGPGAGLPGGSTPDAGPVPSGTVGQGGGTVDRLWFATTGDTRPGSCDDTPNYPRAAITSIAKAMKALDVQFALDLGDHMYVCNGSAAEAQEQMGYYTSATAGGPATWFMAMGNHECGRFSSSGGYSGCFGTAADANYDAYMAALQRPKPYYSFDVATSKGLARFVVIADDAWSAAQKAWLSDLLTDADVNAAYTIIARHHPLTGTRTGNPEILSAIEGHRYSLILTAHTHTYARGTDHGGRSPIVGIGGAPGSYPPGFATVLQQQDGSLQFTLRDAVGNPVGTPWVVSARQ